MENNALYNIYQAGFRPNNRTSDHIFTIKTLINKYQHKCKKPIFACFVDFTKAFDSVWQLGLYKKLLYLKIGEHLYKTIKYMYICIQIQSCGKERQTNLAYLQFI